MEGGKSGGKERRAYGIWEGIGAVVMSKILIGSMVGKGGKIDGVAEDASSIKIRMCSNISFKQITLLTRACKGIPKHCSPE